MISCVKAHLSNGMLSMKLKVHLNMPNWQHEPSLGQVRSLEISEIYNKNQRNLVNSYRSTYTKCFTDPLLIDFIYFLVSAVSNVSKWNSTSSKYLTPFCFEALSSDHSSSTNATIHFGYFCNKFN